ncbi:type II secretion system protein [Acinetobacter larvae]|uniref:Type II secretion system protein GspH n=1 Tax=Acinetobacter larvae TaxID=1789224 RepID=A0A1B2LYC7_9GAMM|nr:type II secretion system protein [Acinetobacter larvae]AOA57962.1 hypothetical protein BFG52_06105 [Acinetobacter larvae]
MQFRQRRAIASQGFTLVEILVVIVIMGLMLAIAIPSIRSVDHRRAMQARELFILDLKQMTRLANDQGQVYALAVRPANETQAFQYQVLAYQARQLQNNSHRGAVAATINSPQSSPDNAAQPPWQPLAYLPVRQLPTQVSFDIRAVTDVSQPLTGRNQDLLDARAPQLIWFGNGEVKPVYIQFYYKNQMLSAPIQVDYMGNIDAE